jgi:hypothetical protein
MAKGNRTAPRPIRQWRRRNRNNRRRRPRRAQPRATANRRLVERIRKIKTPGSMRRRRRWTARRRPTSRRRKSQALPSIRQRARWIAQRRSRSHPPTRRVRAATHPRRALDSSTRHDAWRDGQCRGARHVRQRASVTRDFSAGRVRARSSNQRMARSPLVALSRPLAASIPRAPFSTVPSRSASVKSLPAMSAPVRSAPDSFTP